SACSAPARILMRVDLPAPFSPTSARISPRPTDSVTLSTARTPGYVLTILRISKKGSDISYNLKYEAVSAHIALSLPSGFRRQGEACRAKTSEAQRSRLILHQIRMKLLRSLRPCLRSHTFR